MSRRVVAVIAFAWVLSLVSVGVWAQSGSKPTLAPVIKSGQRIGDVMTGENIGFQRIAGSSMNDSKKIVGRWMVKIDGQWMETEAPLGMPPR